MAETIYGFIAIIIAVLIGSVVLVGYTGSPGHCHHRQHDRHHHCRCHTPDPGCAFGRVLRTVGRGQHRHRRHDAGSGFLWLAGRHLHEYHLWVCCDAQHSGRRSGSFVGRRLVCPAACSAVHHLQSGSDHRRDGHQHPCHRYHGLPQPPVVL